MASEDQVNTEEQEAAIERMRFDFTNHTPSPEAQRTMQELRGTFKLAGQKVIEATGPCRERSLAMTDLEKSLQWAMAAIAREDARQAKGEN
jgi:hypothetical protein